VAKIGFIAQLLTDITVFQMILLFMVVLSKVGSAANIRGYITEVYVQHFPVSFLVIDMQA